MLTETVTPHRSADASATWCGRSPSLRCRTKKLPAPRLPCPAPGRCSHGSDSLGADALQGRKKCSALRLRKADPERDHEHHRRAGQHHRGVPTQAHGPLVDAGLSKRAMASPAARPTRILPVISSASRFQFRSLGSSAATSRTCSLAVRKASTSFWQFRAPRHMPAHSPAIPKPQDRRRQTAPVGFRWGAS